MMRRTVSAPRGLSAALQRRMLFQRCIHPGGFQTNLYHHDPRFLRRDGTEATSSSSLDTSSSKKKAQLVPSASYVDAPELQLAESMALAGKNVLLTGPAGTGKRAGLLRLADTLSNGKKFNQDNASTATKFKSTFECSDVFETASGRTVVFTSLSRLNTNIFRDAMLLTMFLGLKAETEVLGVEQAESTMLRHVRLMGDSYANIFPTIANTDVLVVDSFELMSPAALMALDRACREVRKRPDLPLGGLQLIAAANFWKMDVTPSSPMQGYLYQTPLFNEVFPSHINAPAPASTQKKSPSSSTQSSSSGKKVGKGNTPSQQILMHTFFSHDFGDSSKGSKKKAQSSGGDGDDGVELTPIRHKITTADGRERLETDEEVLTRYTLHALFGNVTAKEVTEIEASVRCSNSFEELTDGTTTSWNRDSLKTLEESAMDPVKAAELVTQKAHNWTEISDDHSAVNAWFHRFPKQLAKWTNAGKNFNKKALRRTAFGTYLLTGLAPMSSAMSFGFAAKLNLSPGQRCVLTHDMIDRNLPAGTVGVVTEISEHIIGVRFEGLTTDIRRMRIESYLDGFSEISYVVEQFPLAPADVITTSLLQMNPSSHHSFYLDPRSMTNTNDLGNVFTRLRSLKNIVLKPGGLESFMGREGMVHESTRVYYESLLQTDEQRRAVGINAAQTSRWCRNCKSHIPTNLFQEHWKTCVEEVRWCHDCSVTIPAEKWEAHCEKHTIVMCIDCGRSLEWRFWDQHRLTCGAMLRELTSDNPLLPDSTKDSALQSGFDRRDLHSIKSLSKSLLPKSRQDVRAGPRTERLKL